MKQYDFKNLTLVESLEFTRDMWLWLAKNPGREKEDYFNYIEQTPLDSVQCACCWYTYKLNPSGRHIFCLQCPLGSLWGRETDVCERISASPFAKWENDRQNPQHALEIANAAIKELERLGVSSEPTKPKLRPWKPEEVPVGALIRNKINSSKCESMIIGRTASGLISFVATWESNLPTTNRMLDYVVEELEHSLDHGKTWLPCGVVE